MGSFRTSLHQIFIAQICRGRRLADFQTLLEFFKSRLIKQFSLGSLLSSEWRFSDFLKFSNSLSIRF